MGEVADAPQPRRGEVWMTAMDPVRGHGQAGTRPAVVVSADMLNRGRSRLVVVVPLTRRERRVPFHVELFPPEGGVEQRCFIKCEDVRSISHGRLVRRMGRVSAEVMLEIEERLRFLLDL